MITLTVSGRTLTPSTTNLGNQYDAGIETFRVILPLTYNSIPLNTAGYTAYIRVQNKNGTGDEITLGTPVATGVLTYPDITVPAFVCAVEGNVTIQIIVKKADSTFFWSCEENSQFKVKETINPETIVDAYPTVLQDLIDRVTALEG